MLSSNEDRDSAGVVLFLRSAPIEVGGEIALYLRYKQIQSKKESDIQDDRKACQKPL